jgi:hypothetical protein
VIVAIPPPEPPIEIYYPVPVYTGVVVINPPDRASARQKDQQPVAPGPPPNTDSPTRTIAERPHRPSQVEPHPPSTPRGDEPPREHHATTQPIHSEPVHITPPPHEEPRPQSPHSPLAPVVQPTHDPKPVAPPPSPGSSDKDKK